MTQEKPPAETGAADKSGPRKQKMRVDAAMMEKLADRALEDIVRKLHAGELKPHRFKEEARKIIEEFAPDVKRLDTEPDPFLQLKWLRDNGFIPEGAFDYLARLLLEGLHENYDKKNIQ